MKTKDTEVLSR